LASIIALIAASWFSSSSLARRSGLILVSDRMSAANLSPIPWMYWSAKRIFFLSGTSIPAIRGMRLPLDLLVLGVRLADHPHLPLAAQVRARPEDPPAAGLALHDSPPSRPRGGVAGARDWMLLDALTMPRRDGPE